MGKVLWMPCCTVKDPGEDAYPGTALFPSLSHSRCPGKGWEALLPLSPLLFCFLSPFQLIHIPLLHYIFHEYVIHT